LLRDPPSPVIPFFYFDLYWVRHKASSIDLDVHVSDTSPRASGAKIFYIFIGLYSEEQWGELSILPRSTTADDVDKRRHVKHLINN
jgi:hypothetical protein